MLILNLIYYTFFLWLISRVLIQMMPERKCCSPTLIYVIQSILFFVFFLASSLRNVIVPPSHIKPVILILENSEFILSLYEDQNQSFQILKQIVFIIMLFKEYLLGYTLIIVFVSYGIKHSKF